MAIRDIISVPHPVLREKAKPVENIDDEVRAVLNDLADTLYNTPNGAGLAANQIGIARRLLVIDIWRNEDGTGKQPLMMVNPEIIWKSEETSVYNEGCFSVPEQYAEVERPARVRVAYQDPQGAAKEIDGGDNCLLNHVLQHEIDHLNGIVFVDHLSSLKRDILLRKLKKLQRGDKVL